MYIYIYIERERERERELSKSRNRNGEIVKLHEREIPKYDHFQYLGSKVQKDWEIRGRAL